jgi:hypothetical protein
MTAQVLLPGQSRVQDGPVDLVVVLAVHHAFRRDLASFARAVPAWSCTEQEHVEDRPMPLAQSLFLVPRVCDGVPEPVRRRAFAEAGRAVTVVHALSRPWYERQSRRAFARA